MSKMPPPATVDAGEVAVSRRGRAGRLAGAALAARWPVALGFGIVAALLWQLAAGWAGVSYFLGPAQILAAIGDDFTLLASLSADSLARVLAGFALGAACGVVAGLLAGYWKTAGDLVDPVVSATYPLPKIALFPAFAVILGYTDISRVLIIALAAFYPVYLNAHAGARAVDGRLLEVARNLEIGRWKTLRTVVGPAALPQLFVGLRIGLAVSFVLLYVAEALGGAGEGLGFQITFVAQTDVYAQLYALIACFAVLGVAGDRCLLLLGRKLTRGQELEVVGDAR